MKTADDVIMRALCLFWGFGCKRDEKTAMALLGIITDWRDDCRLLTFAGEDGAA
jgi:hypothetical protein